MCPNEILPIMHNQLPISYFQKPFWLEWKLSSDSTKYNTPLVYRLKGNLNEEALSKALSAYIQQFHQVAQHVFLEQSDGEVLQIANPTLQVILEKEELELISGTGNLGVNKEIQIDNFIKKYCHHIFNLIEPPLFKFGLLKITKNDQVQNEYVLVLNFHHTITDAFTATVIVQYVSALYNHYAFGKPWPLFSGLPFKDYVLNEQLFYPISKRLVDLNYWKNKLANKELSIPLSDKRVEKVALESDDSASYYFSLDIDSTKALRKLVFTEGASFFVMLSAIYSTLLYRYTYQQEICFSYFVNARPVGYKNIPGCFTNLVPLIVSIDAHSTFHDLIHQLISVRKETKIHQNCSLIEIIQALKEEGLISGKNHFNIGIGETFLNLRPLQLKEIEIECLDIKKQENFNDLLLLYELNDRLEFKVDYRKTLFDEEFIKQFSGHFLNILQQCILDVNKKISSFCLLSSAEHQKIVKDWNNNQLPIPNKTLHQLFEEQAARTPDAIAVLDEERSLTYNDLNQKANQIARIIQENLPSFEKRSETIIGICMDRQTELVIGILGILKAGVCYLPLDPEETEHRVQMMLKNASVDMVLTLKKYVKNSTVLAKVNKVILLDDYKTITPYLMEQFSATSTQRDLAYVIYTSGTTGIPKGVMVEHKSVVNIILDIKSKVGVTSRDKIFNLAPMAFDIYELELFLALLSGACHILCSKAITKDPEKIVERINQTRPTIINASPTLWSVLIKYLKRNRDSFTILSTAEPLCNRLAKKLHQISKNVWNLYGPTETTIVSCYERINSNREVGIGKGFSNTELYVLDKYMNLVPIGVPGQLYISGAGLARGYLNAPDLTQAKFIPNFFSEDKQRLMYHSGDIVRWRVDGTLEYLGREDRQIKIRGYRIELEEIESAIFSHPRIRDCAVDVFEEGNGPNLIAYYVPKKNQFLDWLAGFLEPDPIILSHYIKKRLPDHMQPVAFVKLEQVPKTITGKLDRIKLPKPKSSDFFSNQEVIRPYDSIELNLKKLWEQILKRSVMSVHDDFFLIGGHSLAALYLVTKINEAFNMQYPVAWVLEYKTIRYQAEQIRKEKDSKAIYNPIIAYNICEKDDLPLFLVHSALAGAEVYDELSNFLGKHHSCYAIDSYNLNSGEPHLTSVEALASKYIQYLRTIKPKGPYLLGGWSFGGMIAFEMAQQLIKMGETVSKVYLMDGYIFRQEYIKNIYNVADKEDLVESVPRHWSDYLQNLPESYLERLFACLKNDVQMIMKYSLKSYPGPVMLIKSTKFFKLNKLFVDNVFKKYMHTSWKPFVKNLEIRMIYADHFNLLEGKRAKEVAEIIQKDIEGVRSNKAIS